MNLFKNALQILAPSRNDKSELSGGLYSLSNIQDCFDKKNTYIIKKHEKLTDNPPIRIYVNKTENRITLKIKTGYYLKLLTPETMKLFQSTKHKITKSEDDENVPHLEIIEEVLQYC